MARGVRVEGALVLSGPGARRLPVGLEGGQGRLRIELRGAVSAPGASLELARRLGTAFERWGVTVELVAGPFRVAELGHPGRDVRTHLPGMTYLLLRSALVRLVSPLTRLFR